MYELSVEREFCAAHAIRIGGAREPTHGHNWRVTVAVAGDALDSDGILCDFHAVERELERIIAPFHNADLNATPPFDRLNPTAEHVAQHIAETLAAALPGTLSAIQTTVTEAPGCKATYRKPL
jgi:6-pyruvoyltetrahydropterin/6-carboxytetrahydropterin synthase